MKVATAVDKLGEVRAKIAELLKEQKVLEDVLKDSGMGSYEGDWFRATVSIYDRENVAWKAVAERLNPSHQLLAAHTTQSAVTKITVSARLTDKASVNH